MKDDGNDELHLLHASTLLRFEDTTTNGINPIHRFVVPGTTLLVALHENVETKKLFPVWKDTSGTREGRARYLDVAAVMELLAPDQQAEVLRLRPILSRRAGVRGEEDVLAGWKPTGS